MVESTEKDGLEFGDLIQDEVIDYNGIRDR